MSFKLFFTIRLMHKMQIRLLKLCKSLHMFKLSNRLATSEWNLCLTRLMLSYTRTFCIRINLLNLLVTLYEMLIRWLMSTMFIYNVFNRWNMQLNLSQ